jgi:hypothetical protein
MKPLLLAFFVLALGCHGPTRPMHMNESLRLTNREIQRLSADAERGDGDAAMKIHMHFAFYIGDHANAEKWLERAAQLGRRDAQDLLRKRKTPNKSPEPTSGTVMPRAEPRVMPVPPVAHL